MHHITIREQDPFFNANSEDFSSRSWNKERFVWDPARSRSVLSNSPAARRSMTKSLVIERRAKGNRHCSAFS